MNYMEVAAVCMLIFINDSLKWTLATRFGIGGSTEEIKVTFNFTNKREWEWKEGREQL